MLSLNRTLLASVLSVACLLIVVGEVQAQSAPVQVSPSNATGIQPYNTFGGVRESINYATGNLSIQIPLVRLAGRNGQDLSLSLLYDSKIWNLTGLQNPDTGEVVYWWEYDGHTGLGPRFSIPTIVATYKQVNFSQNPISCLTPFITTTDDGSKHEFGNRFMCRQMLSPGNPQPNFDIPVADAKDASFMRLDTTNAADKILHKKNGERLHFSSTSNSVAKIEDTNGNVITYSYPNSGGVSTTITDNCGRVVTISTIAGSTQTITYKDSNATTRTITLTYSNLTIAPMFTQPAGSNRPASTKQLLTTITLPTNRTYTLQYNNYGELTKITYPTGGYTRYEYSRFTGFHRFWGDVPPSTQADFREIVAKNVCRDSAGGCTPATEDRTTYTPTIDGGKMSNQYMDVRDPYGNRTRYEFSYGVPLSPQYWSPRELFRYIYSGESNLLRTVQTEYTSAPALANDSLPIRRTTTLNDISPNLVTKTEWDYDSLVGFIDNIIAEREYDYGNGAPGPLLRQRVRSWLKTNPVNGADYTSTAIYILDRQLTEVVKDGAGATIAQTQFEYDNYAATGGMTASGATQHTASFGTSYLPRGNLTSSKRWLKATNSWLPPTSNKYDDAGNVLRITDPGVHQTNFSYADSWNNAGCVPPSGNAAAYVTSVTNAKGHITSHKYNSCAGTKASITDPNGQTTIYGYDLMDRLTLTTYPAQGSPPAQGQVSSCFSDAAGSSCFASGEMCATIIEKITSSLSKTERSCIDGVGSVSRTELTSDPEGPVLVDITYDNLERRESASNPYRSTSDSTYGVTSYEYDALSRITKVIRPDSAQILTSYLGNLTTVMDEAGKQRKSRSDALGRVTAIWEAPGGVNYETSYQYDSLDNLIRVDQKGDSPGDSSKWRKRTFTYDSLSRLKCAANPEVTSGLATVQVATCPTSDTGTYTTGTIGYTYDNEGSVLTKTSASPNQTNPAVTQSISYCYDELHRMTGKAYNGSGCPLTSPVATYFYDQASYNGLTITSGKGRRTGVSDAAGAEAWSYDSMGRVLTDRRTTNSVTKNTGYTYNLDGSMAMVNYPSGRTVTYTPSTAGRTVSAVDTANSINYVTAALYAPQGGLSDAIYGKVNGGFVGIVGKTTFNNRLQPKHILFTTGTPPTLTASACPATPGNVLHLRYDFFDGTANNGNVQREDNCRVTYRNQNFTYDALNRLTSAYTTSSLWGNSYVIDPWGNLTNMNPVAGKTDYQNLQAAPASIKNQLPGFGYDAAGNMTSNGGATYTYDAENRLLTAGGVTYTYDGDAKRVKKSNGKLYWMGMGSDPLTETNLTGTPAADFIFFNGKRAARLDLPGGAVHYYFSDHLGSTSEVAGISGSTVTIQDESDYYPYGLERVITNSDPNQYKFTANERDSETGLDYFGARYYGSNLGRFSSVDPTRKSIEFSNPQSWNRYTYALNNPLGYVDRNGLWPTWVHNEIVDLTFAGILPSSQIRLLQRVSHDVDFKDEGQAPKNSYRHSMCAPGQALGTCSAHIMTFVNGFIGSARAAQAASGQSRPTDAALALFGKAGHTLMDMGSPEHVAADGTPITWTGSISQVPGHFFGELWDWYGIGQSIRNTLAGYLEAFPEERERIGDPETVVERAVGQLVNRAFANAPNSSPIAEDMARQCALGNRAACN